MHADHQQLRSILENFDGKEIASLQVLKSGWTLDSRTLEALLTIMENEDDRQQIGASWIVLNYPELHSYFGEPERARLMEILASQVHWQVTLHILQFLPFLNLSCAEYREAHPILIELADHQRPFVRAWSYNALYLAADKNEELRPSVSPLLRAALNDEKASVRARIRNAAGRSTWIANA